MESSVLSSEFLSNLGAPVRERQSYRHATANPEHTT
ncbi:hypothetical protein ANO14919_100190 [Xylariales sp. No.14919]|nr:hypothetical protein ANO14919_100190 [Xylariales sp. No.14919]